MSDRSNRKRDTELELQVIDEPSTSDSVVVTLDHQSGDQSPKSRKLLLESDWNRNEYYGLGKLSNKKVSDSELTKSFSKEAKQFYIQQNETIEILESLATEKVDEDDGADQSKRAKIAIWGSFLVNITLVVLKIIIAIRSGSISVIASALDSVLDILSGSVLFVISRIQQSHSPYSYPIGKERLEPLGIIVFSTVMFTAALQLIIEAVKRLIVRDTKILVDTATLAMLIGTIAVKAILFIYCHFFVKGSPSAEALAQDHRNDVISNSGAILSAYVGYKWWWAADPIGAIAIGLLIMVTWAKTGFEHMRMLTGYRADPNLMKKWTFLSIQHDSRILAIDTVRAYHLSNGFIVEVDIVLPEDMPLNVAHDIGESLQSKLESLEEVERAFVHLDYETTHKPEH